MTFAPQYLKQARYNVYSHTALHVGGISGQFEKVGIEYVEILRPLDSSQYVFIFSRLLLTEYQEKKGRGLKKLGTQHGALRN